MFTIATIALAPPTLRILFVGNSLLNNNDVPATVAAMLRSDGAKRSVTYRSFFVPHLEDVPVGGEVDLEAGSGRYDVVVLQGAMVSSSMTRTYAQTRGTALAVAARSRGARVLFYVEWPRRGVDETEYTMNVYRGIARNARSEIVPICYAWNAVHERLPNAGLWLADGNHATASGSYIAAAATYFHIAGTKATPAFVPQGIDPAFSSTVLSICRNLEARAAAKRTE